MEQVSRHTINLETSLREPCLVERHDGFLIVGAVCFALFGDTHDLYIYMYDIALPSRKGGLRPFVSPLALGSNKSFFI